jgi:putative endonuclease
MHIYYVYILTNYTKTVLYTGVTNDIGRRLNEHRSGTFNSFSAKYRTYYLVHLETFEWIQDAIRREKVIKKKKRVWKDALIAKHNPMWVFMDAP